MPTALVTGVAGFIGSNLAVALLDRGYDVRGIDNFETGRRQNIDPLQADGNFEFHETDIRDANAVAKITNDVDYVFHQAAVPSVPRSVENPVTSTDANCTGTAAVLNAARRAGVDTAVVASSSSVYGSTDQLPKVESMEPRPESPYALSKYFTEKLALQFSDLYDTDTVALRYFNIFGPHQDPDGEYAAVIPKFINLMLQGKQPVIYGDGEQSRDFTFIENAIQANILAAEGDVTGEAFNVGCGGRVSINELVERLNEHLGIKIQPEHSDPRPGDIRHSHADISKAEQLLGYTPSVEFTEGIEKTIEYYRNV
jgi:nucleoside-diphosphate-sugar epimerase